MSIRTFWPSVHQFLHALAECRNASLTFRIFRSSTHEHTDPTHPFGLLRAGNERNRSRAAHKCDELAPSHLPSPQRSPPLAHPKKPRFWADERTMSVQGCKRTYP
jgi:hypothetical protein